MIRKSEDLTNKKIVQFLAWPAQQRIQQRKTCWCFNIATYFCGRLKNTVDVHTHIHTCIHDCIYARYLFRMFDMSILCSFVIALVFLLNKHSDMATMCYVHMDKKYLNCHTALDIFTELTLAACLARHSTHSSANRRIYHIIFLRMCVCV